MKKHERTDKQIIWQSIKAIENQTMGENDFIDLRDDKVWEGFDTERQKYFRALLLRNGLIHMNGDKVWEFRLTADGIVANEADFAESGALKIDKSLKKQIRIAIWGAVVGSLITGLTQPFPILIQKLFPDKPKPKTIVLPKIQIVRDTIYLKKGNH